MTSRWSTLARTAAAAALAAGCSSPEPELVLPPTLVTVSRPIAQEVVDHEVFTGRVDAREVVEVRARVGGYLEEVSFKDGEDVEKGALLFVIDPRPYEAEVERAKGELLKAEAQLKYQAAEFKRIEALLARRAASRDEFEKVAGERAQAEGAVQSAKATLDKAKLDLGFTRITAPISGRTSRPLITVGNLIPSGGINSPVLTTIIPIDPIYVYFDVDEQTMLRYFELFKENSLNSSRESRMPCQVGVANEKTFPHDGIVDFVENRLDPTTGTLRIRAKLENPKLTPTIRLFNPGMFVRVQLAASAPHEALLVTERAIGTDLNAKYVYVVNEKNEVEYRPVVLGMLSNGLREVKEGITAQDWVIVNGMQRVRPGVKVEAKQAPMPVLTSDAAAVAESIESAAGTEAPQKEADSPSAVPKKPPGPDGRGSKDSAPGSEPKSAGKVEKESK